MNPLASRILKRLSAAQWKEPEAWYGTDYEIAHRTVAHAARGDCHCCTPDVLASYEVLGIHPAKVWPKIIERRKALLGSLYDDFFPEALRADLPPKKPAGSVRFLEEEERLRKASGAESEVPHRFEAGHQPLGMAAATTRALHNSGLAPSGKHAFPLHELTAIVAASSLPDRLRNFAIVMLKFDPTGEDIWAATNKIAVRAGVAYITARRRIDALCDRYHVFYQKYSENRTVHYGGRKVFRHTATYAVDRNSHYLRPRQSYEDWLAAQPVAKPFKPQPVTEEPPDSPVPAKPARPVPAPMPAPDMPRRAAEAPGFNGSRREDRVEKKRVRLMALVGQYIKGINRVLPPEGGMGRDVGPGDDGYVPPLSPPKAVSKAAKELGMTFEEAEHELKLVGWTPETEDGSQ